MHTSHTTVHRATPSSAVATRNGDFAGLPGPIMPQGFGVNIHFTSAPRAELRLLQGAGFGLVRMDLTWAAAETKPGIYDFSPWDTLTSQLASVHIRPLLILDYTNPLYDSGLPPHSPVGIAAYAHFCAAAARHFRGRQVIWELWNEPNGVWFWKPQPDPNDYAEMAIAAAHAMRLVDPNATIIAPAASGIPLDYLGALFKGGLLSEINAVSVHPYRSGPPESAAADYSSLRALIAKYAHGGAVPIVCSEWGYSTSMHGVTEEQQAAYLAREYLVNLSCGVDTTIIYDWQDDGDDPGNREDRFGTIRVDLARKPAYDEARSLIGALRGFRFVRRLAAGDPAKWKLEFARGHAIAYVAWNPSEDSATTAAMPQVTVISAP